MDELVFPVGTTLFLSDHVYGGGSGSSTIWSVRSYTLFAHQLPSFPVSPLHPPQSAPPLGAPPFLHLCFGHIYTPIYARILRLCPLTFSDYVLEHSFPIFHH